MGIVKSPLVAVAMAATMVSAQDAVTFFFPGADAQSLVGSVVTSDASRTTLAVVCATDVPSDECGFVDPVTVTVGPSTFHAEASYEDVTAIIDCALTGSDSANCGETYIGPADYLETDIESLTDDSASTGNTEVVTTSTSTVLSSTDIAFFTVPLTDQLPVAAAETGATGTLSSASSTRTSGSSTSADSSSGSSSASRTNSASGTSATGAASTTSASGNTAGRSADIRALAYTAVGAGLLGLTAFLL